MVMLAIPHILHTSHIFHILNSFGNWQTFTDICGPFPCFVISNPPILWPEFVI